MADISQIKLPNNTTYDIDAKKVNGKTVESNVPSNAVFTDTKNTAGSTDTSSKIFLIGATSQAANPQTYSQDTAYVGTDGCLYSGGSKVITDISGKVSKTGDLMTGTLRIESSTGNYAEGIRINRGNGNYCTLLIGAAAGTSTGTSDGTYWIGANPATKPRILYISHNGSTESNTYFYANSSSQKSPNLRVGGEVFITPANADTGCKMSYNATTQAIDFVFN